jgi:hypothetical protein
LLYKFYIIRAGAGGEIGKVQTARCLLDFEDTKKHMGFLLASLMLSTFVTPSIMPLMLLLYP